MLTCSHMRRYSSCPELNDVLHLQCKGITKLENLDVSFLEQACCVGYEQNCSNLQQRPK